MSQAAARLARRRQREELVLMRAAQADKDGYRDVLSALED